MEKLSKENYIDIINIKKKEAHNKQWLYIELNAKQLLDECETGVKNQNTCCKSMLDAMLEGDSFIIKPANKSKCAANLTIRYYVDNLSIERKKYVD